MVLNLTSMLKAQYILIGSTSNYTCLVLRSSGLNNKNQLTNTKGKRMQDKDTSKQRRKETKKCTCRESWFSE